MDGSSYLIQADFFFLGLKHQKLKFVACAEAMTGMVGASFCGPDVAATLRQLSCFFRDLGLNEQSMPVETLTDAEPAITSLLSKLPFKLLLKKAAPQEHRTIGRAERTVRRIEEMVGCLRSDLRANGFDLIDDPKCFIPLVNYIVQSHNHFGVGSLAHDGVRRSPHELAVHKDLPKPEITMFGAIVHAAITDSVREMLQPGLRFTVAAYLHPDFNGLGHRVSAIDMNGEVLQFVTKVKPLSQLCWDERFCLGILKKISAADQIADVPAAPETEEVVDLSEELKHNGPPKPWVEQYGPTKDCTACNSRVRHGKNHSSACRQRYTEWLKQERLRMRESVGQEGQQDGGPQQSQLQDDVNRQLELPDIPLVVPDPQIHPTGGRRTVGKQAPRLVVEEADDDMGVHYIDDPMSDYAPSTLDDDAEIDQRSDVEMADFWMCLSPPPEEDWRIDKLCGVMFPFYVPTKDQPFESTAYDMLGRQIFLMKPKETWSEDGTTSFGVDDAEKGRVTELDAMRRCNFGVIMDEAQAKAIAAERNQKVIPCRWVITAKDVEGQRICRARCVAQQIAKAEGVSAISLGISSSTPSLEALRVVLTCVGAFDLWGTDFGREYCLFAFAPSTGGDCTGAFAE